MLRSFTIQGETFFDWCGIYRVLSPVGWHLPRTELPRAEAVLQVAVLCIRKPSVATPTSLTHLVGLLCMPGFNSLLSHKMGS